MAESVALSPVNATLSVLAPWVGPKPIRLRILDVIAQRLTRIRQANGFYTEIGERCTYGQTYQGEPAALPSVNVWDQDESGNSRTYGAEEENEVLVVVEAYTLTPESNPALVPVLHNWMLADIKRAVWEHYETQQPDPGFNGLADGVRYLSSDMMYGSGENMYTGTIVQFSVTYRALAYDPSKISE